VLIPDYKPDEGLVFVKCHHCWGDGLAVSTFFLSLTDDYDAKHLPGMKPLSYIQQIMIELQMPFRILIATFKILVSWYNLPPNVIQRS
jgi:hypothetical protein